MIRAGLLASLVLVGLGPSQTPTAEGLTLYHFALSKSVPEAESTVASPPEIRLWFTQVPQEGTMSIRLLDGDGEPVPTDETAQDAEDGRVFSVTVPDPLPAGRYSVRWRGLGEDGHVVRGEFSFSVSAP